MTKRSRKTSVSASAEAPQSSPQANNPHVCQEEGKEEVLHHRKYTHTDPTSPPTAATDTTAATAMRCSLPPHKGTVVFNSYNDYEIHYVKEHTNRCSACGMNFPTAHFLGLHMEENHNSLREALQARGERTFACFVDSCDRKCSTPQKRRLHLIDKHAFPKVWDFESLLLPSQAQLM